MWQPMDTYPNDIAIRLLLIDGTAYPGAHENGIWSLCRPMRFAGGGYCYTHGIRLSRPPDAWMPLPKKLPKN